MTYDILIVGSGIASATMCAILKEHGYKILVIEVAPHIGGDCYDYKSKNTYVHLKGPHLYHSPNNEITAFLSKYTEWIHYNHIVMAEIENEGKIATVPFPYSNHTANKLGKGFSPKEVIEKFFKGYSKKMWGTDYDLLPNSIKGRVPKDTKDFPVYYPSHHQCMPKNGFTSMMENMFDGVDIILNAPKDEWTKIKAKHIVFCGRLDHLKVPGSESLISDIVDVKIPYRSIDFSFKSEENNHSYGCLNYCHERVPYIRKTHYGYLYGDRKTNIVGYELPRKSRYNEVSPHYPIPSKENLANHNILKSEVKKMYPNLILSGRLSGYKYLDMWQVCAQSMSICKKDFNIDIDIPNFEVPNEWWEPKGYLD